MKLTLSVAALHLLLLRSADAAAFLTDVPASRLSGTATATGSTSLNAVDSIVSAYQKKGAASVSANIPSAPETAPDWYTSGAAGAPAVVDAPSSSSIPSLPDMPSVPDVDSTMSALTDAAARASEAARQAAMAASSITATPAAKTVAAKTVAAKQAAAVAAAAKPAAISTAPPAAAAAAAAASASASSGKALSLSEYVLSGGAGAGGDEVDRLSLAQEKLGLIGKNFESMTAGVGVKLPDPSEVGGSLGAGVGGGLGALTKNVAGMGSGVKGVAATAGAAAGGAAAATTTGFDSAVVQEQLSATVGALNLEQNGPWYAAGAAFIVALGQRNAGRADAMAGFEAELEAAKEKADLAAAAAAMAADGARQAKEMAVRMEGVGVSEGMTGAALLDSSRMRLMEVERETMQLDLEKLAAENSRLNRELGSLLAVLEAERTGGADSADVPGAAAPATIEVMDPDPEEDARILEIIKEMDQQNTKGSSSSSSRTTKVKAAPKKKAAAPKRKAAKTKTAAAAKKAEEEKAAAAAAEAEAKAAAEAKAKAAAEAKAKAAAEAEAEAAAEAEAKAAAMKAAEEATAARAAVEAEAAAKAKEAAAQKTTTTNKKKAAPKKKVVAKKQIEANSENPWAELSDSTLKRKTIAQLSEYLSERQITVTGESGKPLKKVELVSAVRSL